MTDIFREIDKNLGPLLQAMDRDKPEAERRTPLDIIPQSSRDLVSDARGAYNRVMNGMFFEAMKGSGLPSLPEICRSISTILNAEGHPDFSFKPVFPSGSVQSFVVPGVAQIAERKPSRALVMAGIDWRTATREELEAISHWHLGVDPVSDEQGQTRLELPPFGDEYTQVWPCGGVEGINGLIYGDEGNVLHKFWPTGPDALNIVRRMPPGSRDDYTAAFDEREERMAKQGGPYIFLGDYYGRLTNRPGTQS